MGRRPLQYTPPRRPEMMIQELASPGAAAAATSPTCGGGWHLGVGIAMHRAPDIVAYVLLLHFNYMLKKR